MSKKQKLSVEDKRNLILEIFHESADVFVLKDIEKLGSKKGINSMLIKDILQSLVDDNLVHQEKIGISNYFWSFPSEASAKLQAEEEKLAAESVRVDQRSEKIQQAIEQERERKEQTEEHEQGMEQIGELKELVAKLEAELKQYQSTDPDKLKLMREGAKTAVDAGNRWLDNIYLIITWCKKVYPGQEEGLMGFFKENGYSDNLEYMD